MISRLRRRRRERQRLVRALATMDALPRAVFERARFEDFDYHRIAVELGISVEEVERNLAAAMVHIDRCMGEDGGP